MSAVSVLEALARCAVTPAWEVGMCGQFCAAMYGYSASGYRDALTQWGSVPAGLKHPGSTEAPAGALVFWGGGSAGHGHVAIADGTGDVWSIDISGPGTVSRVPAGTISVRWGLPYLGWTSPYFQGAEWSPQMIYGADVSAYQPINFPLTTPSDNHPVDFVIIKITEGMSTTAGQGYNTKWTGQRLWARDHGLATGFYHFARPGSMVDQADHFLSQINLEPGDILAFDWEDAGVSDAQKDAWISYVQAKTGHKVILYCNKDFWINRDTTSFAGDGLWIATGGIPAGSPGIKAPWLIHQYSTAGDLDHDLAQFASRDDMISWAGGDMALTADDKTWFTNTIKAQVVAAIKAEAYGAVVNKDAVRSPDDNPANPTWALASYEREGYLRLLEILAQARSNGSSLTTINTALTAVGSSLDQINTTLSMLDLSHLPADIAAKIEALKISIGFTEGP
jgi:hypothetical protein